MFEQMKGLTPKKKVEYFIQYYGIITLVIIAVIWFAIYMIKSVVTAKDPAGGVVIINQNLDTSSEGLDDFLEGYLEEYGIDTGDYEFKVYRDMHIGDRVDSQTGYATLMKLQAFVMSKEASMVIVDDEYLEKLVAMDAMQDLYALLPEDLCERYAEDFVMFDSESAGGQIAAMIKLPYGSEFLNLGGWYEDKNIYIGVTSNAENLELNQAILIDMLQ